VRIQVSHGADTDNPEWFVVWPLPGEVTSAIAGTRITNEMAVQSLEQAGRSVYELDVKPWENRKPR
jgi:hypothetical protein